MITRISGDNPLPTTKGPGSPVGGSVAPPLEGAPRSVLAESSVNCTCRHCTLAHRAPSPRRTRRRPASDRASASPPGFAGERSTPATLTQNSGADASIRAARSRGTRGIAGRPTWAARGSEVRSPAREWSTAIQLQGRALFSWRREKYPFADGLKNLSDPKLFGGADQLVRAGADTPVPRLPTRRPRATGHAHSV